MGLNNNSSDTYRLCISPPSCLKLLHSFYCFTITIMQFTHALAEFRFPPSIFNDKFRFIFMLPLYCFVSVSFPFHFMLSLYCFISVSFPFHASVVLFRFSLVSISFHAFVILLHFSFHFMLRLYCFISVSFPFCFSALFVPCNRNKMLTFLALLYIYFCLIGAMCCTHTVRVRTKLYMSVPFNRQPISVLLPLISVQHLFHFTMRYEPMRTAI